MEELKNLQEKHYTYIQLVLGRPWIKMSNGEWRRFGRELHISLCYLPAMLESTIARYAQMLQKVVLKWVNTRAAPLARPYDALLVPVRQVVLLDAQGKEVGGKMPLVDIDIEEVKARLDGERENGVCRIMMAEHHYLNAVSRMCPRDVSPR